MGKLIDMPAWTVARIKGRIPDLPETFQRYAVLRDGEIVGEVRHEAGSRLGRGGQWRADLHTGATGADRIVFRHPSRDSVLAWFKTGGEAHLQRAGKTAQAGLRGSGQPVVNET